METHPNSESKSPRGAAVSALAIVGFIALILLGMGLAIYAARFVPIALSEIGQAAASLSGIFTPDDGEVEVVDEPTYPANGGNVVTIPIATTTTPSAETPETTPSTPAKPATPTYTAPRTTTPPPAPTYRVVTIPSGTQTGSYYGSPDLTVEILDLDEDGDVKFRIANRGTNVSGAFEVSIRVKTEDGTDTDTVRAPSMKPGASVTSTGTFDANADGEVEVTITVDSGNDVRESNERNNRDTEEVRVRD